MIRLICLRTGTFGSDDGNSGRLLHSAVVADEIEVLRR